jgi:hypothetical protein
MCVVYRMVLYCISVFHSVFPVSYSVFHIHCPLGYGFFDLQYIVWGATPSITNYDNVTNTKFIVKVML